MGSRREFLAGLMAVPGLLLTADYAPAQMSSQWKLQFGDGFEWHIVGKSVRIRSPQFTPGWEIDFWMHNRGEIYFEWVKV